MKLQSLSPNINSKGEVSFYIATLSYPDSGKADIAITEAKACTLEIGKNYTIKELIAK